MARAELSHQSVAVGAAACGCARCGLEGADDDSPVQRVRLVCPDCGAEIWHQMNAAAPSCFRVVNAVFQAQRPSHAGASAAPPPRTTP